MQDGMYILMEDLNELRWKVRRTCDISFNLTVMTDAEVKISLKFSFGGGRLFPDFLQSTTINPKDTRYTRFEVVIKEFVSAAIANVNQYIKKGKQFSSIAEEI